LLGIPRVKEAQRYGIGPLLAIKQVKLWIPVGRWRLLLLKLEWLFTTVAFKWCEQESPNRKAANKRIPETFHLVWSPYSASLQRRQRRHSASRQLCNFWQLPSRYFFQRKKLRIMR
jgi:hypothetical protein